MLFRVVCFPLRLLCLHDGHGHGTPGDGASLWHYLVEPEHWPLTFGTVVSIGLIAYLGFFQIRRMLKKLANLSRNTRRKDVSI
jgi:hypothetical protein